MSMYGETVKNQLYEDIYYHYEYSYDDKAQFLIDLSDIFKDFIERVQKDSLNV